MTVGFILLFIAFAISTYFNIFLLFYIMKNIREENDKKG